MTRSRFPIVLVSVALLAAAIGAWVASRVTKDGAPTLVSGTWLPQARTVAPFALVDGAGTPFDALRLKGAPSIVFFGFTHCPDVCPNTLSLLARAQSESALRDLRIVFVTIDPERDTPRLVGDYARAFGKSFVGLTGPASEIERLTQQLGVAAARVDLPGGAYTMDHSSTLFLFDAAGRNVAVFTPPFDAAKLVQDLRAVAERLMAPV
jgi:protein SCO1